MASLGVGVAMAAGIVTPGVGAVGLVVGATLFDRLVLMPGLAGKPKRPLAPDLLGKNAPSYKEGDPTVTAYGRRILVPTHVMFTSQRVQESSSGTGKGGPQARSAVRSVFADMAFSLSDAPINRLIRLNVMGTPVIGAAESVVRVTTSNWTLAQNSSTSVRIQMLSNTEADFTQRFVPVIKDGGTATGTQGAGGLEDTSKTWTTNQHQGRMVMIVSGPGAGQRRFITASNTHDLTVSPNWGTVPVSGSSGYQIEGQGDYVELINWGSGQDGYWMVYSVTRHLAGTPSWMTLVAKTGQTPAVGPITGGTPLNPASIRRVESVVIDSDATATTPAALPNLCLVASPITDFSRFFKTGDFVTLAGWLDGGSPGQINQASWRVGRILNLGLGSYSMELLAQNGFAVTAGHSFTAGTYNNAGTIGQNVQILAGAQYMAHAPNIHYGSDTETEDSILAQHLPSGTIPGFRHRSWVAVDDFDLTEFGNAPPIPDALVEPDPNATIGSVIRAIYGRTQLQPDQINTTACESVQFAGMFLRGALPTSTAMQSILVAHQIATQERDGVLFFLPIEQLPTITIRNTALVTDFGTHIYGDPPGKRVRFGQPTSKDLPTSLTCNFQDFDNGCQPATEHFGLRAPLFIDYQKEDGFDFSMMSMTREFGRNLLQTVMRRTHMNGNTLAFELPANYLNVLENDIIPFTDLETNAPVTARVVSVTHQANRIVSVQAVQEDLSTGIGGSNVSMAQLGNAPSHVPPSTDLNVALLDIPPIIDAHAFQPGLYVAACSKKGGKFTGCRVYVSTDGGTEYVLGPSIDAEHAIGTATTTLADGTASEIGGVVTRDAAHDVSVQMDSVGPLGMGSVTAGQTLLRLNWFAVGSEIVAPASVTLQADGTYLFHDQLRGLRASVPTGHVANEQVVQLTDFMKSGRFVPLPASAIGTTVYVKFVQPGQTLSSVTAQSISFQGWNCRPLPIYDGGVVPMIRPGGTNDVYLQIRPRTRLNLPVGSVPPWSFDESFEHFSVRFYTSNTYATQITTGSLGGDGLVFTSMDMGTGKVFAQRLPDQSWWYTAALQTADGLTPGGAFYFDIRQLGDNGWSRALRYSA